MLLSYVFQKTGRLTFEEKCKILEFMGTIVKETVFPPPALCKSDTMCIDLSVNQSSSTVNSNSNPFCNCTPTIEGQLKHRP